MKTTLTIVLVAMVLSGTAWAVEPPLKILFIGNSFTNGGPIPTLVRNLAVSAGLPAPNCVNAAINSQTLQWHTTYAPTLAQIDSGGWDYVVVQDYSTRPTDSATADNANPAQFEHDVTWFYDRIKLTSPNAKLVLYETWARHENHNIYPSTFLNRDDMQEQLNYWYHHAAFGYIPQHATSAVKTDVVLAPCGEVWHANYHGMNYNLHGGDMYHAGPAGEHVNALTIFGAIYRQSVSNLPGGGAAMEDYLRALVDQANALYLDGGTYNRRPVVHAGIGHTISLSTQAVLDGTVSDDGMPDPPALAVTWTKQSGPGTVVFADAHAVDTTAGFSAAGVYVLRLTADDGDMTDYGEVTVTVYDLQGWPAPVLTDTLAGSGPLAGSAPSLPQNAADRWVDGASAWSRSSSGVMVNSGGHGAQLPVALAPGKVYILSADVTADVGWLSVGFSSTTNTNPAWAGGNYAWILLKSMWSPLENGLEAYAGSGTGNPLGTRTVFKGKHELAVVLDTTAASWTVVTYVDGAQVGSAHTYATNPDIRYVAITNSGSGTLGTIANLRLTTGTTWLLGDFNGDGSVTHGDYTVWADHYGQNIASVQAAHPGWFAPGSYVAGGVTVTQGLYTTWADHFGQTVSGPLTITQAAVPAVAGPPVAAEKLQTASTARAARIAARLARRQQRVAVREARRPLSGSNRQPEERPR